MQSWRKTAQKIWPGAGGKVMSSNAGRVSGSGARDEFAYCRYDLAPNNAASDRPGRSLKTASDSWAAIEAGLPLY